jgi:antitoxin component YwqK of YwqJK toxin-antitoxin module
LRDGYYESFFDNGQLDERAALNNGKIVGLYESFYDTGQIWLRAVYENGEEVRYERFDRDGKRVK